jgi:hypothetical protein
MNELARSTVSPEVLAAKWNKRFAVGTRVRYWTGVRHGMGKVSNTRSEARVLGGHTAVVWIEDETGCVALSHLEPEKGSK